MAVLKTMHTIAASALLGLLFTASPAQARDWRWYPRKAPAESGALRPDLEGTRNDETEQSGISELDEMRRWLQKRDEDRRQQGITVPDTVERYEPIPGLTIHRHRWPARERPDSEVGSSSPPNWGGTETAEDHSDRVRDTLFPHSYDQRQAHGSRRTLRHRQSTSSRRTTKYHSSGSSRHRTRR